ncbi:MAG: flagellar protein FlaG [Sphingomonadaceae bacterium]
MVPRDDGIAPVQAISTDRRSAGLSDAALQPDVDGRAAALAKTGAVGASERPADTAVEILKAQLQSQDARITFETDKESGKLLVRVKDASGNVIRQIPPDEILRLAKAIDQYLGLLVDRQS